MLRLSREPYPSTNSNKRYKVLSAYQELSESLNFDIGHDVDHASAVLNHTVMALTTGKAPKFAEDKLAIEVASILHNADSTSDIGKYPNICAIVEMIFPEIDYGEEFKNHVIYLVDLICMCKNTIYTPKAINPWDLYPLLSDRLESLGGIGILRYYYYCMRANIPLFLDSTELATTEEELAGVCTPERYQSYIISKNAGNSSVSFIDYFYDKIFHICNFDDITTNPYLREESRNRTDETKAFIFSFGKDPTQWNITRWITHFRVKYSFHPK